MQCFDFCNLFVGSYRCLLYMCMYTFFQDAYVVLCSALRPQAFALIHLKALL